MTLKIAIVAAVLLLSACSRNPTPATDPPAPGEPVRREVYYMSTEANIAVRGTQVLSLMRQTIPTLKTMVCGMTQLPGNMCLTPEAFIQVLNQFERAGKAAEQLVVVLEVMDRVQGSDKVSYKEKARELLNEIARLLGEASIIPGSVEARGVMLSTIRNINALLFAVLS